MQTNKQTKNLQSLLFHLIFFPGFISDIIYIIGAVGENKDICGWNLEYTLWQHFLFKFTFQHEQIHQQKMSGGKYKIILKYSQF